MYYISLMPTFNQQTLSVLENLFQETINKQHRTWLNIDHYHGDENETHVAPAGFPLSMCCITILKHFNAYEEVS